MVLIKDFLIEGGATYTLSIVDSNGHLVAKTAARKRTTPYVQIGNVSTSATTVYYLDGDSAVRFLRPDGTTGLATHIVLSAKHAAAFAVSQDDRRIAVSVLDFTRYPVSTRLYVEDLHGGGNHIELFASPNVEEWPVGWHAGHLVIAVGLDLPPQNFFDGFEAAFGYHLVDAQSGKRLLSLCSNVFSQWPESPAGIVCNNDTTASVVSWDGRSRVLPNAAKPDASGGVCPLVGPLSPAGVVATWVASASQGGCGGDSPVFLVTALGGVDPRPVANNAQPIAWLDTNHLVVDTAYPSSADSPQFSIVDVNTLAAVPIQAAGFFAAALPGGL